MKRLKVQVDRVIEEVIGSIRISMVVAVAVQ